MQSIELLAPARDLETGLAAINCGADAVYLGAAHFGAREAAGNPLQDIEQLTRYAHRYWAKVYVTVNTLLTDDELPQAEKLIHELYAMGVDALIIQDMGLLECSLPPIPLFASTQMHNHTPERVAFLEKVGFQRAILARELTLEQISQIHAAAPQIELESFIHGALCVSYSGQCYLSYALGGRSGNRGQCAQACRKLYRLEDASGQELESARHLLSLRDLNLSGHLPSLLEAGISSFKIEGRLKDKTYVMNVVSHYRQKLDQILAGSDTYRAASSGKSQPDFTPDLRKTFNRGFTTYFLHDRAADVKAWDTPKSLGEPLGNVKTLKGRWLTLDSSAPLHSGDGICFFNAQGQLVGTTINEVQGAQISPDKMEFLAVGAALYRNHDHEFVNALNKSAIRRKMGVSLQLEAASDGLLLHVQDEDGCQARAQISCALAPAEKPEQMRAILEKQLRKLGETDFTPLQVEINLTQPVFVPVSVLNQLRREAIDALLAERVRLRSVRHIPLTPNAIPYPQTTLTYEGNVLNDRAAQFYRRHGVQTIQPAAESGLAMQGRKVMTTRYCLKYELGACPKRSKTPTRLSEPLFLVDEQGNRLPLRFNCADCQMEVYFRSLPSRSA